MNTDGPSYIDPNTGDFILSLPDWESLMNKVIELELKIKNLESKVNVLEYKNGSE